MTYRNLGYLKIVTPKHMRKSEGSEGSTRIVFGTVDGVTKTSKPVTNWTGEKSWMLTSRSFIDAD